jgi:hypothetical protein
VKREYVKPSEVQPLLPRSKCFRSKFSLVAVADDLMSRATDGLSLFALYYRVGP